MIPSPGRIVEYTLDNNDAERINGARKHLFVESMVQENAVAPLYAGNPAAAGDKYPMVIVRVWGSSPESSVNGQVLLDGNDTLWVTSVAQGDGQRQWREFPRV